MTRNNTFLTFLFFILLSPTLWAQSNDECSGATVIADPANYCTPVPGENNTSASPSAQAFPSCWTNVGGDLWYSFTAVATDLLVIVKGFSPSNPTATMQGPLIAVYSGDCNNLTELGCAIGLSNNIFINNLPVSLSNLVVGQQYFIRIDGIVPGLFQLCVKNKEGLSVVKQDCSSAIYTCSKEKIELETVSSGGSDDTEMDQAPCFQTAAPPFETNSAWYTFTAANNGKLMFTITPNEPFDDIDFVLYRLPNGPGDCTGKISQRCMASGWDLFDSTQLICMGPTGLNATSSDVNSPPGCPVGLDNFIRFLTLVPGATYALVINNYTSVGNGFTLEWGGDALFQGQGGTTTANFSTDQPDPIQICVGEELVVTDLSSTTSGVITDWKWDFGSGSIADSTYGQGPHTIHYLTEGPKRIILTVITEEGCATLDTVQLLVLPAQSCCALEAEVTVVPGCPYEPTATPAIATVDVQNGIPPLTVTWSNDPSNNTTSDSINSSGTYTVTVVDANGCSDSQTFDVNTPLNVSAIFPPDTTILQGTTISLGISAMPTDSLTVSWTDGEGNVLNGPTITITPQDSVTYFVVVNNTGCVFSDSVTVRVDKPKYERPNAFTPNGDGANDTFGPVLVGHTLLQLEVWSRWGKKVFDSIVDGRNTWDGNINGETAPSDVYVYRVRVRLVSGEEKVDKGDVTLLR